MLEPATPQAYPPSASEPSALPHIGAPPRSERTLHRNKAVSTDRHKKGRVTWRLIAVRKRKLPFYDEAPLAFPGTPEVREYMAIGIIDDEETRQPSEIKEVVYAG
jgi:hypothetical protein